MGNQAGSSPNFYALLIGINFYHPNPLYENLKGAVRDIKLVAEYLEKTLNLPPERIFKLTSSNPEDPSAVEPVEPQDVLPTYTNIVKAFDAITNEAPEGSQVYIHYSGHGGRAKTIYPEIKGDDQPDEGIVPMDYGSGGRYLLDVELALLLKRMSDKGLVVTVVLDSCHSGGATRGDDVAIRGTGATDAAPPEIESSVAKDEVLVRNWKALTEGVATGSTLGRWLPKSRDYVLLAACRPNEYAYEYTVSGKQRHGALTYWMINTLTSSLPGLTYKALHDRVSAKIQSKFSSQMPMLMGEIDRVVFGSDRIQLQYAVLVMEVIEDPETDGSGEEKLVPVQVRLNTGMSGGIGIGARFAIYPPGTTDFTDKAQQLAIVDISGVNASDSWADVVEIVNRQGQIEQGCQAVMTSAPVDLVRGVRLLRKEVGDEDNELPPALTEKQEAALKAVEDALTDSGWLNLADAEQKGDYLVAVNRKGEYEICNGLPIENLRPALAIEDTEAPAKVIKRLVHLAKYQAIEELSNQFSELTSQLEVELMTQPNWRPGMPMRPKSFADQKNVVVRAGEYTFLRIKNKSSQVLNIAVLDLEPTWAISRLQLESIESIFYVFNPGRELLIPLSFRLPDNASSARAREILKVFATLRDNDLGWLELPSLDEEISKKAVSLTRSNDPLGKLLAMVGSDIEETPLTRAAIPVFDPSQEWTTKEVQITLVKE